MTKELTTTKKGVKLSDQQKAYLDNLSNPGIKGLTKVRMREAARQAGYSDNTTLREINEPLLEHITALAERMLAETTIDAVFALQDALTNDEANPILTKTRLQAAQMVLDRMIAKKESAPPPSGSPQVVIMLPPKESVKVVEIVKDE